MNTIGGQITPSKAEDDFLDNVVEEVFNNICNEYILKIPDNWKIIKGDNSITFKYIRDIMHDYGIPDDEIRKLYGQDSCIKTDSNIIYLQIKNGDVLRRYPLFMGENKKQGTNDKRLLEGKKKQAQGNAACDRVAKNFTIAADACYYCDNDFFPYNVFLHGYDFSEDEITKTTKSKVEPFFGQLNVLNPFFNKYIYKRGGSCFYQYEEYTHDFLFDICYRCCQIGIEHYLKKFSV